MNPEPPVTAIFMERQLSMRNDPSAVSASRLAIISNYYRLLDAK